MAHMRAGLRVETADDEFRVAFDATAGRNARERGALQGKQKKTVRSARESASKRQRSAAASASRFPCEICVQKCKMSRAKTTPKQRGTKQGTFSAHSPISASFSVSRRMAQSTMQSLQAARCPQNAASTAFSAPKSTLQEAQRRASSTTPNWSMVREKFRVNMSMAASGL